MSCRSSPDSFYTKLPKNTAKWAFFLYQPPPTQTKTITDDETVTFSGQYQLAYNDHDYDDDGKADPAVYNESLGWWGAPLSGSGYVLASTYFGGQGYRAVPADYDGDGKADPAVYNESLGWWGVPLSGSGYALASAYFGGQGYRAVPADFDGDTKTDPAVFKEATGLWYMTQSSLSYLTFTVTCGAPDYLPVW